MKICIIAPGSQGDVQPFIALGKGLITAGNSVRLVSNQDYEDQVKSHGIKFSPIEVKMEDIIRTEKMREVLESGKVLASIARMGNELKENAALLANRSLEACQDVDMIMAGLSGLFTANSIAEKLDIPFIQASNLPFTPTKAFPGLLFPKFPSFLGMRFSHKLTQQIIWQAYRPTDKIVREEVLKIPKSSFFGPFKSKSLKDGPIIYSISPSVFSRPSDWPDNIHITGYWTLNPTEGWSPPADLVEFLQEEPKPLYIGFGSMSSKKPEETANLIIEVLKRTNQRAIVFSGWGGLNKSKLPDFIMMIDSVPHSWLFPRVKTVIHHGGAGTTAAGLSAGVPSIIIPFHGDQPFWGLLTEKLGVGVKPIPRKKLSVDKLTNAIQEVICNEKMRKIASDLGAKIQAEEGITEAIKIIKEIKK